VLDIVSASGQATLELGELQITELKLTTHASSLLISLPTNAGQTSVNIQASTVTIMLRVPPEVGAYIQSSKVLTTPEIDLTRFPMTEQTGVRSAFYGTAVHRVDITWIWVVQLNCLRDQDIFSSPIVS
jgi:hypothetical protein